MRRVGGLMLVGSMLVGATPAATPPRVEITHPGRGHEVQLSGAAVAGAADGTPLVSWVAQEGNDNVLYAARAGRAAPVRVNPPGTSVDSLHQPPGIAAGPDGALYITWSSRKPVPVGGLFASDLRLSSSGDGGATWTGHVRLNDDQPTSHSFEGLAVARDGTVLVAWIETRDGKATTMLERVTERGTRVATPIRLDTDETCVCCRIDVSIGPSETVGVLWRKVFAENVREMVLAVSRDGGRSFAAPVLVHADGWKITACPHRGGSIAADAQGRLYAIWYTEATEGRPDILFATSTDARRFSPPRRVHTATGSIPDQARLAVDPTGRAVIVWEDSTAVRRRILMRTTRDGGHTLTPAQSLSSAIKAFAPAVAATPAGFIIVWHEEQFPSIKTVVQTVTLGEGRR